jgi:hypothetical protein
MKQTIRPPKGWRLLRPGTVIKKGDKYYGLLTYKWEKSSAIGQTVRPSNGYVFVAAYARKIKRKASK